MAWSHDAWSYTPNSTTWDSWGEQCSSGWSSWGHPSVSADSREWVNGPGTVSTTRCLVRQDTDNGKTYECFSVLGGTSKNALPRPERAKLVSFMMPAARKLRVATLTSNELDAVIYIATGQQPTLRVEHRLMPHAVVSADCKHVAAIVAAPGPHSHSDTALVAHILRLQDVNQRSARAPD